LSRNKVVLTENQKDIVMDLVSKDVSGACIAKKLGVSQSTLWRIMESLGLNKKKNFNGGKTQKKRAIKYFNWNQFKGTVI